MIEFENIVLLFILLAAGYGFGSLAEWRHYRSIIKREKVLNALPAIASRYPATDRDYEQQLVFGSVVVSSDYFKTFLAGLLNLFGGAVVSYEALIDRARREAMLRMKQQAQELGAQYVFNIKYETMRVGGGRMASVEVLAYGTALTAATELATPPVENTDVDTNLNPVSNQYIPS